MFGSRKSRPGWPTVYAPGLFYLWSYSLVKTSRAKPTPRFFCGGAGGTRTPYLRLAKAALSQLSYGPIQDRCTVGGRWWTRTTDLGLIRTAL